MPCTDGLGVQNLSTRNSSRAVQASSDGRFVKNSGNMQLHSLLHINFLWLVNRIKQA
jgi:hypothetical protein